ncbi:queuosine precursor transporter [Algoriphagus halophytocola]|uniref:Probable queuosine precursor transporter n=1 Tax=Algoriphagus halophytocola TaxID=2991499 RepID=A0ABY6MIQ9_9BACT|nr:MULTISPECIES: queuosine precursor transporter [unclassified Algoriphagus]UZD23678.1 queuosine precursor transporter [Algoriphagus sp. TR-M5]WBL44971.1 queuosine precursor transporter [Algoriphagus sp. TR-M9]
MNKPENSRKTNLFIILGGIFLTNAILAEIIGVKIFSAEKTLGFTPVNWSFFGEYILDFNLTAGAVIWPVVFITTDIINEYFGKKGVRKISFLTAGLIAYAFVVISLVTALTPADFWLDVNATTPDGDNFDISYAFNTIFRQGLGIIIGSLTAFLLGQLIDVYVFQKLRSITGENKIWLRATGSTLVSQFIDSFVVLGIAFYVFGNWSLSQIIAVGIMNYIYKMTVAIVLTPLLYVGHGLIDKYLGKELSAEMIAEASEDKSFL